MKTFQAFPRRQQGAILVIALLFLVLLTIIGISSISSVTLEERMAGNLREQTTAFQAAESALRDAEIDLEKDIGGTGTRDPMTIAVHFAIDCSGSFGTGAADKGACRQPAAPAGTWQTEIVTASAWNWTDANKTVAYGTYTGAPAVAGVARQPRYVIEYLQEKDDGTTLPPTRYFRITARGWGGTDTSTVTLQSIYRTPLN
jgi:type IV pilus assembly protein PilX